MARFIQYDRNQQYLLPPSVDEWLPEDHLARYIVEVVDQLDLTKLTRRPTRCGSEAYHPALLLALLVYGYATGTFSSRKIERATQDSVAFRFIAANLHPDHDTLAHFRKTFLVELEDLFVQVLAFAQTMKLVKLGQISLDGTKIKANASKHKALSHGLLKSWKPSSVRKCRPCWRRLPKPINKKRTMSTTYPPKSLAANNVCTRWPRQNPRLPSVPPSVINTLNKRTPTKSPAATPSAKRDKSREARNPKHPKQDLKPKTKST